MSETMKAVRLYADWDPRPDFKLGAKDIDKKQTYLGSKVWRNPRMKIEAVPVPKPGPGQVLVEVKACGICGSDVHMAQADEEGYIWYPGLTGFPCTLGHGTFPRVIASMAAGMNMLPMMTKTIGLDEVPKHIEMLRTDRHEAKITCVMD